jgi:hypothetical protein
MQINANKCEVFQMATKRKDLHKVEALKYKKSKYIKQCGKREMLCDMFQTLIVTKRYKREDSKSEKTAQDVEKLLNVLQELLTVLPFAETILVEKTNSRMKEFQNMKDVDLLPEITRYKHQLACANKEIDKVKNHFSTLENIMNSTIVTCSKIEEFLEK